MDSNTQFIMNQIAPYQHWLIIGGVLVLFVMLRITRKELRRRVDTIGYRLLRERGPLIWFWLNAPGVMVHELSHALTVVLFAPFGFRVTSITLFRVQPLIQRNSQGQIVRRSGQQSLQLGEVQYVRPKGRFMSYVGDGLSGIAPLIGGTAVFILLYWIATGSNLWDFPFDEATHQLQILRPGWPWWTLIFAPYLILTVTSELWPSRQDWRSARWFVTALVLLLAILLGILWYIHYDLLSLAAVAISVASHIDFALLILLALDLIFLLIAEMLVRVVER
jgi:hypothetical protein